MKKSLKQFFMYALIGVLVTLINLVVLYLFTDLIGVYYLISAVFAFCVADIVKYVLHKSITFKGSLNKGFFRGYVNFLSVSLSALLINLFFLYFFTDIVGLYYLISQILASAISLWVNFIGNKFWTFNLR